MIEIKGICKNCKEPHTFDCLDKKMSNIMYCSDSCWKEHFLKNLNGLVYPKFKYMMMNHLRISGSKRQQEKILKHIEDNK